MTAPFLKWAGGKRQLLPELLKHTPDGFKVPGGSKHYYEPFVGGGAVFFRLRELGFKGAATLGDMNEPLIRTYMGVRNDVEMVIEILKEKRYAKDEFLETRERDVTVMGDQDVAAWVIYLNKTCFNGLWRVNQKGKFNVPFGAYTNPTICDAAGLRAASGALKKTTLKFGDFEKTVKTAERGDLAYFDPPYEPISSTANFTGYTKGGFGPAEQERLRDCAARLKRLGVHVVLSNHDLPAVRKLYKGWDIQRVEARRAINSKASRRGVVGELIIT
jgi:DNA adenine methylase